MEESKVVGVDAAAILKVVREAEPVFRDSHDAVAFLLHAAMLQRGCALVGLSEVGPVVLEMVPAATGWNSEPGLYTFQYQLSEAVVILKMMSFGPYLVAAGRRLELEEEGSKEQMCCIAIRVSDHITTGVSLARYEQLYHKPERLLQRFEADLRSRIAPLAPLAPASPALSSAPPPAGPEEQAEVVEKFADEMAPGGELFQQWPSKRKARRSHRDQALSSFEDGASEGGFRRAGVASRSGFGRDDLEPVGEGLGGNLMGPGQFPAFNDSRAAPARDRGPKPRFDPYGPVAGLGRPEPDHLSRPGGGDPPPFV